MSVLFQSVYRCLRCFPFLSPSPLRLYFFSSRASFPFPSSSSSFHAISPPHIICSPSYSSLILILSSFFLPPRLSDTHKHFKTYPLHIFSLLLLLMPHLLLNSSLLSHFFHTFFPFFLSHLLLTSSFSHFSSLPPSQLTVS